MLSPILLFLCSIVATHSFSTPLAFTATASKSTTRTSVLTNNPPETGTALYALIEADGVEDDEADTSLSAGVTLAQESAIIIKGSVDISPTKNQNEVTIKPIAEELTHYKSLQSLSENDVSSLNVICKGTGTELYQDPGTSTKSVIILAPLDAVSVAVDNVSGPSSSVKKVMISFTGGDDLMVHEVLEATQLLVSSLDFIMNVAGDKKAIPDIEFRSLCHSSFAKEKCSVMATVVGEDDDVPLDGNVYWNDGSWWTVADEC